MSDVKERILTLLDNSSFVNWLLFPSENIVSGWEREIEGNPEMENEIKKIRTIIRTLKAKETSLAPEEREAIWKYVKENTSPKRKNHLKKRFFQIVAADFLRLGLLLVGIESFMSCGYLY